MKRDGRAALLTAALAIGGVAVCRAQGGQGGGFGGAAGGSAMGNREGRDGVTVSNVLTPGQFTEWSLTVKDGETLIATAATENFDPAIQIVDADGKTLAENDDVAPGRQNAQIVYRFPKAGSYKLLVKAFKGAGGGQFRLTMRRFVAADITLGARVAGAARGEPSYFRFPASAGQTLLLRVQSGGNPSRTVYGPNGEPIDLNDGAFTAPTKGDYYVRVATERTFAFTVAAARVQPVRIGERTPPQTLGAGGMDLWTFTGAPGDFLRVRAESSGAAVTVRLREAPRTDAEPVTDVALTDINDGEKNVGESVASLRRATSFQAVVTQAMGLSAPYTLSVERALRPWDATAELSRSLGLGSVDFWEIDGKAGDIVQLDGRSDQFDIFLELMDLAGESVANNDDGGGGRNARLTAALTRTGKYVLAVRASGDGGSGAYRVRKIADPVRPLALGGRGAGTLGVSGSDIWSYTGKAGQTVLISGRSSDFDTRLRVFGPDGIEIASDDDGGEGTDSLLSVRLPLDGRYTIWVQSDSGGAGKYTVRLIDAD